MKKRRKKISEKRLLIKMIICTLYLIIITILLTCSFRLYKENENIKSLSEAKSTEEYTYIEVYKMSEKFAFYEDLNIGIHFVTDKEKTGQWHTYLMAINEKEYDKYKSIIDYTYGKTKEQPKPIKVYGYPRITNKELKIMAINNINNFISAENEIKITEENYEQYLTNCYLDSTKSMEDNFNSSLFVIVVLLLIVIYLFILTIIDKNKYVDKIIKKLKI